MNARALFLVSIFLGQQLWLFSLAFEPPKSTICPSKTPVWFGVWFLFWNSKPCHFVLLRLKLKIVCKPQENNSNNKKEKKKLHLGILHVTSFSKFWKRVCLSNLALLHLIKIAAKIRVPCQNTHIDNLFMVHVWMIINFSSQTLIKPSHTRQNQIRLWHAQPCVNGMCLLFSNKSSKTFESNFAINITHANKMHT